MLSFFSLTGPAEFIISMVKSIRNTNNRMKLKDGHQLNLTPHLHSLFAKCETSTSSLCVLFHTVAAQLIKIINTSKENDDMTDDMTLQSLVFSSNIYKLLLVPGVNPN